METIDVLVFVPNKHDVLFPHTSALIHADIDLKNNCACFDIKLGCSGFVHALSIITSFMKSNHLNKGLLFTADMESKGLDPNDKDTAFLFSDTATVSLISKDCEYYSMKFSFGSSGALGDAITRKSESSFLQLNGQEVFRFVTQEIPKNISENLEINSLTQEDIDFYALHPANKYILSVLKRHMKIPSNKIEGDILEIGNTGVCSVPMELNNVNFIDSNHKHILISGFGSGLSWATTILRKNDER